MTQTIAATVSKMRSRAPVTMAGALAGALLAVAAESEAIAWPSPIYAERPVAFVREVLAADMLPEQEAILAALAPRNARVSVASGHKCGKDFIGSVAAWWFFESFEGARVLLTAPTSRQVDGITWREVKLRMRAKGCLPLAKPDEVGELARTGVVAADLREIKGFTARTAEGVAGISAPHILYIVTEASGVEDPIFEAIEGNMAGADARILLITNPTRRRGYFWDSHHKNKAQWHTFQLSSWAIAKSLKASGRTIPSLATERWCQERLEAWGKDDPRYKVRVLGEFVNLDEDKVIAPELLLEAEQRWATTITLDSDVLHVGVDPAGGGRDETACAPRRGQKVFPLQRWREADPDRNAALIYHFVLAQMAPDEVGALVKIDKGGEGWRVVAALNKLLDRVDPQRVRMRVIPIDFGWHPRRPAAYLRLRDELWFTCREFLRDGGALPSDDQLGKELLEPKFSEDVKGRLRVESKDELRKANRLGRSPDSADAVVLAVWPHGELKREAPRPRAVGREPEGREADPVIVMSPYEGLEAFGR